MTILERILLSKRLEVKQMLMNEENVSRETFVERPSLFAALKNAEQLQVISEIKRASPSKGEIAFGVDPSVQAQIYEKSGAACISVLTDAPFFKGSFADLSAVAKTVQIPILCKDFIIHEVQIDRAKAAGASVILLIVAALNAESLLRLYRYAMRLGLEVIVEVHDRNEMEQAITVGARIVGVNNRDLRTFEVDLRRTEEIASRFPFGDQHVLISESGIWHPDDARRVAAYGAEAVLVGESLMRSGDAGEAIRSLQVRKVGARV